MRARTLTRKTRRRQLDKIFSHIRECLDDVYIPTGGWVQSIRWSLGMTAQQLATRLGVSQPAVVNLEKSEEAGKITLNTLQRAAEALDCRLVYILVPNTTLEEKLKVRATQVARGLVKRVAHTMALESQAVDAEENERQIAEIADDLMRNMRSDLWWPLTDEE